MAIAGPIINLKKTLIDAAHWIWQARGAAKAMGFPFSEETVTETVLLMLAMGNAATIKIIPFNKRQEGKIGADWEWCFFNSDRKKFFPMLVQAKVLDNNDHQYPHIDRFIGNTGKKQIDRLLDSARRRGIPAIYAFYNHLKSSSRVNVNACKCRRSCDQCWGCSVALARHVNSNLPAKDFDSIKKFSMPWQCLICSNGKTSGSFVDDIAANLSVLASSLDVATSERADGEFAFHPHTAPPPYFEAVARMGSTLEGHQKEEQVEKLAAEYPDIAGVVLVEGATYGSEEDAQPDDLYGQW